MYSANQPERSIQIENHMCVYLPLGSSSNKGKRNPRPSPYWSAQFRDHTDKVCSISTKLRSKALAKKLEAVWVRIAEETRNGWLTVDTAKRYLDECACISKGDSLRQSEKFIDQCLKASTGTGLDVVSAEDHLRDWLESKRGTGRNSQGTLDRYSPVLTRFVQYLPEARRRSPLASITPLDCTGFLRAEKARQCSAVSANLSIKILRIVFNSARRHGLITMNPAEPVDLLHEEPDKRLPFTVEQIRHILAFADQEWRGIIMVGYLAGVRLGDAAQLKWSNIDLQNNLLVYKAQKTARRKKGDKNTVVDLHPDLVSYLSALQPGVPAAPLFPTLSTRPVSSASGLSAGFRRLMDKAGVLSPLGTNKGSKRVFRALSFHSLRHSFCTQLHHAGVPMELRKALAGHSSDSMAANYTQTSRSLAAAAIAQLPSVKAA
jgi:integrase